MTTITDPVLREKYNEARRKRRASIPKKEYIPSARKQAVVKAFVFGFASPHFFWQGYQREKIMNIKSTITLPDDTNINIQINGTYNELTRLAEAIETAQESQGQTLRWPLSGFLLTLREAIAGNVVRLETPQEKTI
jgi:hypothetical protein